MKKFVLFIAVVSILVSSVHAQRDDIGMFLGLSKYKGELSNSLFTIHFFSPAFGVYYRKNFNRHWGFKFAGTIGGISGDDSYSKYDFEVNRNLNFNSAIQEIAGTFEFNFLPFEVDNYNYSFTPFFFWGLSVLHFNPKTEYRGIEYELQPLATEGQETYYNAKAKKYSLYSAAMPFGGGFKIAGEDRLGFTIECGVRRAYTDYLDDVSTIYPDHHIQLVENGPVAAALSDRSLGDNPHALPGKQRGDPDHPDWYMFVGASAYIAIGSKFKYSCRPFHRSRITR
jgi:hypothetical protein